MDIKEKIAQANEKTVHMLMDSDPVWVDMKPAIECVDGLEDHMILHSGPPIAYEDMTMLHKRGWSAQCSLRLGEGRGRSGQAPQGRRDQDFQRTRPQHGRRGHGHHYEVRRPERCGGPAQPYRRRDVPGGRTVSGRLLRLGPLLQGDRGEPALYARGAVPAHGGGAPQAGRHPHQADPCRKYADG